MWCDSASSSAPARSRRMRPSARWSARCQSRTARGAYAFTVTTNDYFELDGVDDTRVEVKAPLDVGVHNITFQADNGVDPVVETTIPISVTEA